MKVSIVVAPYHRFDKCNNIAVYVHNEQSLIKVLALHFLHTSYMFFIYLVIFLMLLKVLSFISARLFMWFGISELNQSQFVFLR